MRLNNLAGQQFSRLFVVGRSTQNKGRKPAWVCLCDCGTYVTVAGNHLTAGETRSCGCLVKEITKTLFTTHGRSGTRTHRIWMAMNKRCYWDGYPEWHLYGGRGIAVCEKWRHSFPAFLADMGECPLGLSIDRIDNDGNYEPGNCRWATAKQQAANRRPARSRKTRNYGQSQQTLRGAGTSGPV